MAHKLKFGNGVWANQKGSSLAYNDENKNYKPLPFKVTRGSTATRINKQGLIEVVGHDQLRIDYTDSDKGVALLEPSRTNIFLYGLNMQGWQGLSGASFQLNNDISPDGSQNATKITYNGTDNGRLEKAVSTSSGTVYTFSVWLKNIDISDPTQIYLGFSQTSQGEHITITNEWKRYSVTITADASNEYPRINSDLAGSLLAYGAQFEASNYMTSLIPTQGSAVTRQADVVQDCGNSEVFNDSEGVLYANIFQDNDGFNTISISDGGTTDRVTIAYQNNTIKSILVYNNTVKQLESTNYPQNVFHKVAIKYTASNVSLIINGFELLTTSKGAFADSLNTLQFAQGNGGNNFYGKTKELGYYDTALTDSELEYLTSYRSWESMVNEMNLNIIYNG